MDSLTEMIPNPKCELNYNSDYTLLIAILLSAQTLDKNVNKITPILFSKYPTLEDLKNAELSELERIIHPLGLSKNKSKSIKNLATVLIEKYDGKIPTSRKELSTLPGVGNKTSGVYLVEYHNQNFLPVDTHIKRVSYRLGLTKEEDSVDKIEETLTKTFKTNLAILHQRLVLFGRYTCTSKNPKCEACKFNKKCILTK
ncbi:MAG: endonuclease III [Bacilli bacterium]|nr:endonuclease III [Bacilli bacterium]